MNFELPVVQPVALAFAVAPARLVRALVFAVVMGTFGGEEVGEAEGTR